MKFCFYPYNTHSLISCLKVKYIPFHVPLYHKCHPKLFSAFFFTTVKNSVFACPLRPSAVTLFPIMLFVKLYCFCCQSKDISAPVLNGVWTFHVWKDVSFPYSPDCLLFISPVWGISEVSSTPTFHGVQSASRPTPNLEDQGVPFIWVITLHLSGMEGPTSYATATQAPPLCQSKDTIEEDRRT